ncbi:hypothetical protein DUNSADRAFT_6688 [Dunaliella salina]|uniref:Uncharacterized protein n=1 Tax=Dunaliella salina TaxID=3046 RepID=A0ABQ7FUW7_DUNSA|nr:hypothetical protein DUNSADRAFT_6688 [Dunaliella salina]|eukprot:KAF5825822.1 hypothetical protein DUNSADRAFT_6688 [Dunaliella salina]
MTHLLRRLACNVGSALCAPSTSAPCSRASPTLGTSSCSYFSGSLCQQQAFCNVAQQSIDGHLSRLTCGRIPSVSSPICTPSIQASLPSWKYHQHHLWLIQPWEGQLRSIFGAHTQPANPQVHTHDKYKFQTSQPSYDWMIGRFVMDRNGVVWHKQANRASKRYAKSKGTLQRLKRWKALHHTEAAKFRKLPGVREKLRYWAPPDPNAVPGFGGDGPYRAPPRKKAKADRRPYVGDPALLPSKGTPYSRSPYHN